MPHVQVCLGPLLLAAPACSPPPPRQPEIPHWLTLQGLRPGQPHGPFVATNHGALLYVLV